MASIITESEARERFSLIRPLRNLNLIALLQLFRLVALHQPVRYTALFNLFSQQEILSRTGKTLSNSSYYHILTAAKTLQIIQQDHRGKMYTLTNLGQEFFETIPCQTIPEQPQPNDIFPCTYAALRDIVIRSGTLHEAFFWLFRGVNNDYSLEEGTPVTIRPVARPNPKQRPDGRIIKEHLRQISSKYCPPLTLNTVETQSIILGVRQWCIELGILDELITASRPSIPETEVQILFPIKSYDEQVLQSQFETILFHYFWEGAKHATNYWSISVPELLYKLCPGHNISVDTAKNYLAQWIDTHRSFVVLNLFSPSVAMSTWKRKSQDYHNLLKSYLPSKEGYISHFGILDEAVAKGYISSKSQLLLS